MQRLVRLKIIIALVVHNCIMSAIP